MKSFIGYFIVSVTFSCNADWLMYFLYFIRFGRKSTVGKDDSVCTEVTIIRLVAKISSYSHIITFTVRCWHLDTLVYPVPDKTTEKCRITFVCFPIFLEVTNCISHGMGIFTNYVRFYSFAFLCFFKTFFSYAFQPLYVRVHRTGYVAEKTVSFIVRRTGVVQCLDC